MAVVFFAASIIFLIGLLEVSQSPAIARAHNPQDFYLWETESSFAYTFRYDPRAADVWLFKAGGDARFNLDAAFDSPTSQTNR
jgi:hypothetical protein